MFKYWNVYFRNGILKNLKKTLNYNCKLFFIKLIFLIIIFLVCIKHKNKNVNNEFNGQFIITNFIDDIYYKIIKKENLSNFFLILNVNKTKIENIFTLIGMIPFLKKKLIINQKNLKIFKLIQNIFKINLNNKDDNIIITKNYFNLDIIKKFKDLFLYKWENIPKIDIIYILRHIINNYYNNYCIEVFDEALNLNLQHYIKLNKNKFTFVDIKYLMSKFNF